MKPLITDEHRAQLLDNGAAAARGERRDPFPVVKLFTLDAHATWLLTELNPDDGDGGIALSLNSINPGKTTIPHNHDTWAVIVAVEGEEQNRVYRRTDDGRDPGRARLVLAQEVTVRPGTPIAFLPEDIHSIAVTGTQPTLHFHLYGRPLETLTGRIGIDLATGDVLDYNATQFTPSREAA